MIRPTATGRLRSTAAGLTPFEYRGAQTLPRWLFTGGFPDPRYFPAQQLVECFQAAADTDPGILQYGSDLAESLRYGEPTLRQTLVERLAGELPESATIANVMLTTGGVGAIELAYRAFVDPHDVVVVEAPTWPVALTLARQHRAEVVPVEMDADGLRIDQLEDRLDQVRAEGKRVKLLYTIATFQTPTGTVLSPGRRRRLVQLAAQDQFMILEDATYEPLRYEGEPVPSVQSFDADGRVLKVGSFSKTIAPALRLGWIGGSAEALTALASVRTDLGIAQWVARALALFVNLGWYDEHLATLLAAYRRKRDVLHAALLEECADLVDWTAPQGGFFFWLTLRDRVDAVEAKRLALEHGIAARPGEQFFGISEQGRQRLRVAFSQVPEEVIPQGIVALGVALRASLVS